MKSKILIGFLLIALYSVTMPASTDKPVRGVWLTNVDSDVLRSRAQIVDAVNLCNELGFNTIAVVVWNKSVTMFPSKTMEKNFGILIDTLYNGRDPLKELIEEAHAKNIRVIAWFEFGFSCSYKLNGGPIIAAKPDWKAIDNKGNLVSKNNFEWMNGFDPRVQDFMLSMISEVAANYDIDGIQGDDRLPAMPSESGYDPYTVEKYKKEHNGSVPPADFKDTGWVQWRADILNGFMKRIHDTVKSINKKVQISMAPSIYPWCKEEYLQDWPMWVKKGYVELIIPQLYRYDIDGYQQQLDAITKAQLTKEELRMFVPGILLKVGDYYASEELLQDCIDANRKAGINGEFYFFYEGVKKHQDFFKKVYRGKQ